MSQKLLVVDSASLGVRLFYAMGGGDYLGEEAVPLEDLKRFMHSVAKETVGNITRRVSLDNYTSVRAVLETPADVPLQRYAEYPDYKHSITQSDKPRIATALQPYLIRELAREGIVTLWAPGHEADDVIASMVALWGTGMGTLDIWSHDSDLFQVVLHDNIRLVGKQGQVTTREDVQKFLGGHEGTALPLVLAITGDKGANVPGIPHVGRKTAVKWVRPAPLRKPNPYFLDIELVDDKWKQLVLQLNPRLRRDEKLLTLRRDLTLEKVFNNS